MRQRSKHSNSQSDEGRQFIPNAPKTPEQVADELFERVPCFEIMASLSLAGVILLPLWYFGFTNVVNQINMDHQQTMQQFVPTQGLNYLVKGDVEFLWEEPNVQARGLVFLAHGCSHGGYDWWPKSDKCSTCIGLPEERAIVKAVLKRGFIALAVTSVDRVSKCWTPSEDIDRVNIAINHVLSGRKLPIFAFGASSGGSFVIALANSDEVKIQALSPQIAAGHPKEGSAPLIFSHMPRDTRTGNYVRRLANSLREEKISIAIIEEKPISIEPAFFCDRIEEISEKKSKELQKKLVEAKYLDEKLMLITDPRRSDWRTIIGDIEGDTLVADESPISEVMNVAWAQHELVATHIEDILDFFESPTNFCQKEDNKVFCEF